MRRGMSKDLKDRWKNISLLILDVDGVLTDGRIIMSDDGKEWKQFDVKDGHGIKMLLRSGVGVVLLTGRSSRVVAHRARDLGVVDVFQGARDKVRVFDEVLRSKGVEAEHVVYMGDDVVDVPLFKRVGIAIAVADACQEARKAADYVTEREGGHGAVREVCDLILRARGDWKKIIAQYEIS